MSTLPDDQLRPPTSGPSRRTVLGAFGGATALGAASGLLGGAPAAAEPRGVSDSPTSSSGDRHLDKRIGALLRRMTLAEKLGQLQLVNTADLARAALPHGGVGGVFSVLDSATLDELQHQAVEHTRLGIPLIFGLDVIHGYVTNFPIPLGQASSFDPSVAETDARVAAAEARASGQHWTYAPMMDVTHEPRWGRIAEGD